jgi:hypothetical protein
MLEDSNALVFMEAIKCVEYLSILLGKNIKALKLKQFIQLLVEKVYIIYLFLLLFFHSTKKLSQM